MNVKRERNVTNVQTIIIQMAMDVRYVQNNIVQHVIHHLENVSHVKQDIILMETNARNVQTRWKAVRFVQSERSVRYVWTIISRMTIRNVHHVRLINRIVRNVQQQRTDALNVKRIIIQMVKSVRHANRNIVKHVQQQQAIVHHVKQDII